MGQYDRKAPPPQVLECLDPAVLAVLLEANGRNVAPMIVLINVDNAKHKAGVRGIPDSLLNCKLRDGLEGLGSLRQGGIDMQSRGRYNQVQGTRLPAWAPELEVEMAPFEVLWLVKQEANFPKNRSKALRSIMTKG